MWVGTGIDYTVVVKLIKGTLQCTLVYVFWYGGKCALYLTLMLRK